MVVNARLLPTFLKNCQFHSVLFRSLSKTHKIIAASFSQSHPQLDCFLIRCSSVMLSAILSRLAALPCSVIWPTLYSSISPCVSVYFPRVHASVSLICTLTSRATPRPILCIHPFIYYEQSDNWSVIRIHIHP